jgi:hypothetical protein
MFKTDGQKSFFSVQHQEILSLLAPTRRKSLVCSAAGVTIKVNRSLGVSTVVYTRFAFGMLGRNIGFS